MITRPNVVTAAVAAAAGLAVTGITYASASASEPAQAAPAVQQAAAPAFQQAAAPAAESSRTRGSWSRGVRGVGRWR
ncbi:hypothetical protein SHIRM173S_07616 [Streptomyces hirsutus]